MKLSKYVWAEDFRCKCGCGKIMPDDIRQIIPDFETIQKILFGIYDLVAGTWEISLTSGYRCPVRNQAIGGKPYSPHLWAVAIDFKPKKPEVRQNIIEYLRKFNDIIRIGHLEYEKTTGHIHIDIVEKIADALYEAGRIPLSIRNAYKNVKEW